MANPFEKLFGRGGDKYENEKVYFYLKVSYGGTTLTQYFPNSSNRNATIGQLSAIKRQFAQDFISKYAEDYPGTELSEGGLDI